jgi:hypothetical protein
VFAGAALDEKVASGMWAFGTRNASPASLLSPALLARAAWQARRAPRDRSRNAGSPVLG